MAKISSHGAHTLAQVKAVKPDELGMTADGLVHLTLTVTSDGRVLRQVSMKYGSRWSRSNNKVIGKAPPGEVSNYTPEKLSAYLARVATRMGYEQEA